MLRLRSLDDRALLDAVRAPSRVSPRALGGLLARAERHGLAGALAEAWGAAGIAPPPEVARDVGLRDAARACDHAAHLDTLREVDGALARAEIDAVVLKGALLAKRLYPRPETRPTTDLDVMVTRGALERATTALEAIGYAVSDAPEEAHFREEGHHIHLLRPGAPCLELHFHAYRGFGTVLPSEPLVARSEGAIGFRALRVLAPADEILYLAVHAAGHRFMRLGWLYDLHLLLEGASASDVELARERAAALGLRRPLALALELVAEAFGTAVPRASTRLGALGPLRLRRALLDTVLEEPASPLARSASRLVYTLALCDDWRTASSYVRGALRYRVANAHRARAAR